jgi:hypothetical protein
MPRHYSWNIRNGDPETVKCSNQGNPLGKISDLGNGACIHYLLSYGY